MSLTDVLLAVLVAAGIWAVAELAITIRKAQVQQHSIKALGTQCMPGFSHADADIHGIADGAQRGLQAARNARVVLDNQNPHVFPSSTCRRA